MLSLKVKKMLVALALMVALPFVCGASCDESGSSAPSKPRTTVISTNTGGDWLRCDSLTCTYKVKLSGDIKTAISGVRINRGTAVPLGGRWE
jgi:hypothetical protein